MLNTRCLTVAVYKPKGITSHDVINTLRHITGERRIGHAGTLDPLASGVLVVGIGREATRKLGEIVAKEKEYVATVRLGTESVTDDEEGDKRIINSQFSIINLSTISDQLSNFRGKILQTPPVYSAVKVSGKAAYKRARKGEVVKLKPREAEIKEIEILKYRWPDLTFRVVTGPGVYIRSLARDLGRALGTGGYLADLERTRVGEFTKERAIFYPFSKASPWRKVVKSKLSACPEEVFRKIPRRL